MGQRIVKYSDLSGEEIQDPKEEAAIIVEFSDKRRGRYHLDVTKSEAEELSSKGTRILEHA